MQFFLKLCKIQQAWAVVVAQLAERLHPTPEICSSNPDIGNISNVFICQLLSRKDENNEKEAGKGPLKNTAGLYAGPVEPSTSDCLRSSQETKQTLSQDLRGNIFLIIHSGHPDVGFRAGLLTRRVQWDPRSSGRERREPSDQQLPLLPRPPHLQLAPEGPGGQARDRPS